MIKYKILSFKTSVHIGDRGIGVEAFNNIVPSSTIYGGLLYGIVNLYGPNKIDNHPFILPSSIIPLLEIDNEAIPLIWFRGLDIILWDIVRESMKKGITINKYTEYLKYLKETILIDPDILYRDSIVSCEPLIPKEGKRGLYGLKCGNVEYLIINARPFGKALIRAQVATRIGDKKLELAIEGRRIRNVIDRVTGASDLYYLGITKYLVKTVILYDVHTKYISEVDNAFQLLAELGVGGEKTYGLGAFELNNTSYPELDKLVGFIEKNSKLSKFYALIQGLGSAIHGRYSKIDLNRSLYITTVITGRGGYTGILYRPVTVFKEGSILYVEDLYRKDPFNLPLIGDIIIDKYGFDIVVRSYSPFYIPLPINYIEVGDVYGW